MPRLEWKLFGITSQQYRSISHGPQPSLVLVLLGWTFKMTGDDKGDWKDLK